MGFFDKITGQLEDPLDLFGGRAQERATQVETALNREGLQLQRELFDQLMADQAPVISARDEALSLLQMLQGGEFEPFQDPSLDFRRREGLRDIRNAAAAQGKFFAGERFLNEQDLEAGLASDSIGRAINQILNLAGFSTADVASTNPTIASNVGARGGILQNLGGVQARGIIGRANARNQGLNTGATLLGYGFGGGF